MRLWKDLESEDYENELSDEQISRLILKMKTADNMLKTFKEGQLPKVNNLTKCKYLIVEEEVKIKDDIKRQYASLFDAILPETVNDLQTDMLSDQYIKSYINVIYDVKCVMIKKLLMQIEYNSKITNWGYIPEEKYSPNVLIGIDYPGFNMPLKLHIGKQELIKYLETVKGNAVLPVYEGSNDMIYKGRQLTTKVFMPLTEKRESEIIRANKEVNSVDLKYLYIRHMGNLVTKKCKKISKMYPRKYVDLKTRNMGTKRNGQFIPDVENENTNLKQKDIDKGKNLS